MRGEMRASQQWLPGITNSPLATLPAARAVLLAGKEYVCFLQKEAQFLLALHEVGLCCPHSLLARDNCSRVID